MEHDIRHEGYDYEILMLELERLGLKLRHPRVRTPARSQWDENLIRQYVDNNITMPEHFIIRAERHSAGCRLS